MSVHERTSSGRRAQTEEEQTYSATDRLSRGTRTQKSSLFRQVVFVMLGLILLYVLFTLKSSNADQTTTTQADESTHPISYGIVFDAGSTGSRIHVYRFQRHTDGGLRLKDELFEETKPGLSSFAARPRDAGRSIEPLLEMAKKFIPESEWHRVPLALYATAGLRLVSDSIADQILNEVRRTFAASPFRVCADCVRILDGVEEGTFAWYAINYMIGRVKLNEGPTKDTVGVIDLGGGSMQITFLPRPLDQGTPQHFLHQASEFGGDPFTIYTHSYLGLGLNAARFEILVMTTSDSDLHLPMSANGAARKWTDIDPDSSATYTSPCLAHSYQGTWRYHGVDVHVRGVPPTEDEKNALTTKSRFDACYAVAKRLVTTETNMHHPPAVRRQTFYIQSYFLDRAVDAGLIEESVGGIVTINDYEREARRVCEDTDTDAPFLCMDLSFITALLRDGFEFESTATLVLKKKLHGFELSWTIGAVFPLFARH